MTVDVPSGKFSDLAAPTVEVVNGASVVWESHCVAGEHKCMVSSVVHRCRGGVARVPKN